MDVNELYNVALGMYDFELVLFVAEKSQKVSKNSGRPDPVGYIVRHGALGNVTVLSHVRSKVGVVTLTWLI